MTKDVATLQIVVVAPTEEHRPLGSRQRNALCSLFGRNDFTPEEVAKLDYALVERQPKIGSKGIAAIRAWLHSHGYDLNNLPTATERVAEKRLQLRLEHAARLLARNGYRVEPPVR